MQIYPDEIIPSSENKKGLLKPVMVLMKMSKDQESYYSNHQLPELGEMIVCSKIVIDVDTSHSFIAGFKLQHINDIDRISYNYLWTRYLNSEGAFYAA
jgi:hypothetical protein